MNRVGRVTRVTNMEVLETAGERRILIKVIQNRRVLVGYVTMSCLKLSLKVEYGTTKHQFGQGINGIFSALCMSTIRGWPQT